MSLEFDMFDVQIKKNPSLCVPTIHHGLPRRILDLFS